MGFFSWLLRPPAPPPAPRRTGPDSLDGRHYSAFVPELDRLRRGNDTAAYEALLWRCVQATEAEARAEHTGVAPAYYERLAILYRKQKRDADEVQILERYARQKHAPGVGPGKLAERLTKLRAKGSR
jgi:hypothetical protein